MEAYGALCDSSFRATVVSATGVFVVQARQQAFKFNSLSSDMMLNQALAVVSQELPAAFFPAFRCTAFMFSRERNIFFQGPNRYPTARAIPDSSPVCVAPTTEIHSLW